MTILSNCCTAFPEGEVEEVLNDIIGTCSNCHEGAMFIEMADLLENLNEEIDDDIEAKTIGTENGKG
tara:strand:+ start:3525 stop:3725 length:201 start_codon:yes stop_codon:yes gene_type:complete